MCITSKGDLTVKDNSTGCVIQLKNARKSKKIKNFQETGGKSYKKDAKEMIIKITESVSKDSKYENIIST